MHSYLVPFELKSSLKKYLKNNNIPYEYYRNPDIDKNKIKATEKELLALGFRGSFDNMSLIKTNLLHNDYINIMKKEIDRINNLKHEINYEQTGILFMKRELDDDN